MTAADAPPPGTSPAEARHLVENLVVAYTRAVDGKDLGRVVELLAGAEVVFDDGPAVSGAAIRAGYARAFGAAGVTRHLVLTGLVELGPDETAGVAWFPYQRWSLDAGRPALIGMGRYRLSFRTDEGRVSVTRLDVRRDWQS